MDGWLQRMGGGGGLQPLLIVLYKALDYIRDLCTPSLMVNTVEYTVYVVITSPMFPGCECRGSFP